MSVCPVGALEVTEAATRWIPFSDPRATARLIVVGIAIGFVLRRALRWR